MKKQEIIELLAPKCNGVDLPISLDINLIADILVNESKCEHPYHSVRITCLGELSECLLCGENLY